MNRYIDNSDVKLYSGYFYRENLLRAPYFIWNIASELGRAEAGILAIISRYFIRLLLKEGVKTFSANMMYILRIFYISNDNDSMKYIEFMR